MKRLFTVFLGRLFSRVSPVMPAVLRFGVDDAVELKVKEGGSVVECGVPRGQAIADMGAAVAAALGAPLEYPPFIQATTPGDRIVLAVEPAAPQAAQVVAAAISYLQKNGIDLDGIAVLTIGDDAAAAMCCDWPTEWLERVKRVVHNADDARQMAYLARDTAGEPIFLQRALTDADVVLPIGVLGDDHAPGYYGVHTGLFPGFANRKAREAFSALPALEAAGRRRDQLRHDVEQAAWMLGAHCTLQLLPGGGDRALGVFVGDPAAVGEAGRRAYRAAWESRVAAPAALVAVGIDGPPEQQTWLHFARALAAALPLVDFGGALAICSGLDARLGPALQSLCDAPSPHDALQRIAKRHPEDLLPAHVLVQALESHRVYLLSGLAAGIVEQLGMIPLAGPDELLRLARRHDDAIVFNHGPLARVMVGEGP